MKHVRAKNGRRNLLLIIADQQTALSNLKRQKRLEQKIASICSGGNILLDRGQFVTSQDYKKMKRKVMTHAF